MSILDPPRHPSKTPPSDSKPKRSPHLIWADHAKELAEWTAANLPNRGDAYGRHHGKSGDYGRWTAKDGITAADLVAHFRGREGKILGLHTTNPEDNTSRWLAVDIDRHTEKDNPEANLRFALAICDALIALGFRPLLFDSNGSGGYHIWVLFDRPAPTGDVHAFAQWLIRDYADHGVSKPETFPKQASVKREGDGSFGNWIRLFGKHHKRNHWMRVWDFNAERWLDDEGTIAAILATSGAPAEAIPAEARAKPDKKPDRRQGGKAGGLVVTATDGNQAYARGALDRLAGQIAMAPEGSRNDALNWGAYRAGRFVGGGFLDRSTVEPELREAARRAGLDTGETDRTIRSGLDAGIKEPWDPSEKPKDEPSSNGHHKSNGHAGAGGTPSTDAAKIAEPQQTEERPNEATDDPHRLAREYRDLRCLHGKTKDSPGVLTVRYYNAEYHDWSEASGRYHALTDSEMRARLVGPIKEEFDRINIEDIRDWKARGGKDERGKPCPKPKAHKVTEQLKTNVSGNLASLTLVSTTHVRSLPAWLEDGATWSVEEVLAARNGLIHLPSLVAGHAGAMIPATPKFFSLHALDYDFDPSAPQPVEWLKFLAQLWHDDKQSIATLQEWFGYCLTPDTRQQKILMLIGPKRSGKSTIARILRALIGIANTASPTLSGLAGPFGLQPLVGKLAAIITDARLSGRTDVAAVVERLLSISGEDGLTIERKYLAAVTMKLLVRFMLISNELPRLSDASGALAGRMILLSLTESFYGKEDTGLTERLLSELPGILLWAIQGWERLQKRGHFLQPDSSKEAVAELEDLASPVGAFIRERCEVRKGADIPTKDLYAAWRSWCEAVGKREPGDEQNFGRNLRATLPHLKTQPTRRGGEQVRIYVGIDILPPEISPKT